MDKIAELCAAEQKYIDKLQLVAHIYGRFVREAADAELESLGAGLDRFPGILNQHKEIFMFYEQMLEVHCDLHEFWTHSVEEYLNVDRCGQLFYHGLIEERFNVYLHHIVGNPLRQPVVQEDLSGFIEGCLEYADDEVLLLTGFECFQFPLDHLRMYEQTFGELRVTDRAPFSILSASNLLRQLLNRIEEASKLHVIKNCEVFFPRLGTYLTSAEFSVRDYNEGQQHRAELFLFARGVLVAKQRGLSLFKPDSNLEYDSFFGIDQIEIDDTGCFRLKDAASQLTCYKVTERRFLKWTVNAPMAAFLERVRTIKKGREMKCRIGTGGLSFDLGDREVINMEIVDKKPNRRSTGGELKIFRRVHTVRTSVNTCGSFSEAVNTKLCNSLVYHRHRNREADDAEGGREIVFVEKGTSKDMWLTLYEETVSTMSSLWSKY